MATGATTAAATIQNAKKNKAILRPRHGDDDGDDDDGEIRWALVVAAATEGIISVGCEGDEDTGDDDDDDDDNRDDPKRLLPAERPPPFR